MAKKAERSELEYLRGENKTLKSQVKHLKKELARAQKRQNQYADLEERTKELDLEDRECAVEVNDNKKCPKCQSKLEETNIGPRVLVRCSSCEFRETKKT